MLVVKEINTKNVLLQSYVDGYGWLKISSDTIHEKELLPWPGSSWLFVNQPFSIDNEKFQLSCLTGIREKPSFFRWDTDDLEVLAVKFSPVGLSQFVDFPIEKLKDKVIDYTTLWREDSRQSLKIDAFNSYSLDKKITSIENFLLSQLNPKPLSENGILNLVNEIRTNPSVSIIELKKNIPLSQRQFERKFKQLVGVSITTFTRICRFYYAKTHLLSGTADKLTTLGYDSGYFDQAHFSREFKKLSSASPKQFPQNYPLFSLIADVK